MPKNYARVTAVLVCVILMLSLFGCGGKSAQNETAGNATNASSQTIAAETTQKAPEPATITFKTYHTNMTSADLETFETSVVGQQIKEKTNVTVKVLPTKDNATELVTDLAADNMPDVFVVWAFTGYLEQFDVATKAAKEGMLADIKQAVETNGPVISDAIKPERLNSFLKEAVVYNPEFEGKLFFIPTNYTVQSPNLSGEGFYIRGDIAKSLNISTPDASIKTTDDFYNILKKIKDGKFKNTNGKDIYPLGMLDGTWEFLVDIINRPFDFGGTVRIGADNGKLKHFITTDYAWQSILWMRKLLNDGMLDPEALTHKYQTGSEKIAQGQYGVLPFLGYYTLPKNSEFMKTLNANHPEMSYQPLGNMANYLGDKKAIIGGTGDYSCAIGVTRKANADAAVRFLNFMASKEGRAVQALGAEGQSWFWNDKGFAQVNPESWDKIQKGDQEYFKDKGTGLLSILASSSGVDDPNYNPFGGPGSDIFYQNNPEAADHDAKSLDAVMPDREVDRRLGIDFLLMKYPKKDTMTQMLIQSKINEVLFQCALVKTESEAKKILEGFVDTLNKNGLQDYINYLQAEYDKDPNKYATYITSNL